MGTLFPVFVVSRRDDADAARARRCSIGVVAAALAGVARGARAHRRRPARGGVSDAHPVLATSRATSRRGKLTTALTAGGMALVVYVFATVLMLAAGLRADAGRDRPARQRRRHPPLGADRGAERRRPRAGRASSRSLPDIATGARRAPARVEGAGRADQPAEARHRQAVQRDDPRRDAGRRRAAAAGRARRGAHVPARHVRGRRRAVDRRPASTARRSARRVRFASRDWTVVGTFDAGRTGVRFGDLGRRRADAAGVPPHRRIRRCCSGSTDADRFDAVKARDREPIRA